MQINRNHYSNKNTYIFNCLRFSTVMKLVSRTGRTSAPFQLATSLPDLMSVCNVTIDIVIWSENFFESCCTCFKLQPRTTGPRHHEDYKITSFFPFLYFDTNHWNFLVSQSPIVDSLYFVPAFCWSRGQHAPYFNTVFVLLFSLSCGQWQTN